MNLSDYRDNIKDNYFSSARTFTEFMSETFLKMFVGLGITSGVAAYCYFSELYLHSNLLYGSLVATLICGLVLSLAFNKLSRTVAYILYLLYCALTGVAFSIYPVVYEGGSILQALIGTSVVFGALAVYGYTTKRDLRPLSTYLFAGLLGVLIMSVIHLFIGGVFMDLVISWISIIVFMGLTAYDVQKLHDYYELEGANEDKDLTIYGAFQLYLDFINLFIDILRIVGKTKERD